MESPASVDAVELDELRIAVVVDNATDTLSSIPAGIPQLPEMFHLLDGPSIGMHEGHDMVVTLDHLCVACHGFSALATARRGEDTATVLFDVGPYVDVWLGNADRLGIDLASIDALFVSHWHWDHTGAIPTVVAELLEGRGVDVTSVVRDGRYLALDARQTLDALLVDGLPDPDLFDRVVGRTVRRLLEGDGGLDAYGEMVSLLWQQGDVTAALALEDLWNDLQRDLPFRLHCAYAVDDALEPPDAHGLDAVCARHTHVR